MTKEQKKIINSLAKYNLFEYNCIKASEELQELALELTKTAIKPTMSPERYTAITDEIGDVEIRFKILKKFFDKATIKNRIALKLNKFAELLETKEYKKI